MVQSSKKDVRAFIFGGFLFNIFHHENSFLDSARLSRTHTHWHRQHNLRWTTARHQNVGKYIDDDTVYYMRNKHKHSLGDRPICVYDASAWVVRQVKNKRKKHNLIHLVQMYFVLIGQTVYAKCFIHHFDIEYIIIIRWWFRCGSRMAHVSSRPREPRCDAIRIKSIERRNIFILKRLDCGFYGFYWMHHAIVELLCHANHKKGDGRDVVDDYDDDEKMDYKMIQSHGDNGRFAKMAVCVCNLINDSWKNREHEKKRACNDEMASQLNFAYSRSKKFNSPKKRADDEVCYLSVLCHYFQ